jgi:hypothetical protein
MASSGVTMSDASIPACPRCGASIPSSLRFCSVCGAPAQPEPGEVETTQRLHATPAARQPAEPAPGAEPEPAPDAEPEPPSAPKGLALDWEPEFVAVVREAAKIKGLPAARLIRDLVEPEVRKLVAKQRGLMNISAAADFLGAAKSEVISMITAGELKAHKVDGEWMVEKASMGDPEQKDVDMMAQIELDLRQLVQTSGLQGLLVEGASSDSLSATLCYVDQDGVLVCPRSAWRRLGRAQVVAEARDAVRRYVRRRDRDAGKI